MEPNKFIQLGHLKMFINQRGWFYLRYILLEFSLVCGPAPVNKISNLPGAVKGMTHLIIEIVFSGTL